MTLKETHNTEIAAAKSGFSRATGYRYARDPFLSERNAAPRGRRRPDPLHSPAAWRASLRRRLRFRPARRRASGLRPPYGMSPAFALA